VKKIIVVSRHSGNPDLPELLKALFPECEICQVFGSAELTKTNPAETSHGLNKPDRIEEVDRLV
jgi:hypothetical protein